MTSEDDVLPQSQKARAIVEALATLRQAGINTTLFVDLDPTTYSIRLPISSGAEGMRLQCRLALQYEGQARTADIAVQTARQGEQI